MRLNIFNRFITVFIFSVLFSGCSLMFNGGNQAIRLEGKEGTKVLVTTPNGSYEDKLPATVIAKSSYKGIQAKVIDERYNTTTVEVGKSITPSFFANLLNGGYGFIVDAIVGSFWNYDNISNVPTVEKK